jgi:hypothetical protein
MILFAALGREGDLDPKDRIMAVMHLNMVQLNVAIFGGALIANGWNLSRLYAAPVTSAALVAWRLGPAMAIMAAETVVWTAALNALFKFDWPLWGPALFAAVALATVEAAVWLTVRSRWMILALTIVGVVLGIGIDAQSGHTVSGPSGRWTKLGSVEIFSLLVVAAFTYWIAVIGVARNRRGERPFSIGMLARLGRVLDRGPCPPTSFRTPTHAQFAYSWRNGALMPLMVAATLAFCFFIWLPKSYGAHGPEVQIGVAELVEAAWLYSRFLMVVALVGGIAIGNIGATSEGVMGQFLATRPMTNSCLARTVLRAAAKSLLLAWLVWAAAISLLYAALFAVGAVPDRLFPPTLDWRELPMSFLGSWIILGVIASALLAGRPRPLVLLIIALSAAYIGLMLMGEFALSPETLGLLMRMLASAVGAIILVATAWAFVAARRRRLLDFSTAWAALGTWTVLVIWVVLTLPPAVDLSTAGYILLVGVVALAVMPLAAAPLALTWNRHR